MYRDDFPRSQKLQSRKKTWNMYRKVNREEYLRWRKCTWGGVGRKKE